MTNDSANAIIDLLRDKVSRLSRHTLALFDAAANARLTFIEAHPLGMIAVRYKCDGFTIRIHVWTTRTSGFRDEFGQVHDHTWHLESHVLKGRVENHVFDLAPSLTGEQVWLHDYTRGEIVKTDRHVILKTRYDELLNAGDSYLLPAGTIHSTSVVPGSITIVKSVPSELCVARIIGAQEEAQDRSAARASLDVDHVLAAIRDAN